MKEELYNKKYILRKEGFFHNYIYKYSNYEKNIRIGNKDLLMNKSFTIFLYVYKNNKIEIYSLGLLDNTKYNKYLLLISYIYKKILYFISKYNINIKELKELTLCIW